jgi:peptidoglycan/xylan/chitin deacetylase (PgdA/CDA1 family)
MESTRVSVPILTYHSLDDSQSVISVAPETFRRQMQRLREWGYVGLRLSDLIDAWEGKTTLPAKPVVITFDDGYASVLEHAATILFEVGFKATVFVVTSCCGRENDWPSQPAGIPRLPMLSWSALKELPAAGLEVGAHTMTHPPLTRLSSREAAREIVGSKQTLEDRLARAVDVFAYPYGLQDQRHRDVAAAHFRAACTTHFGKARATDDRHHLRRIDAFYVRPTSIFGLFPTPLGWAYLRLRSAGRFCRAAASGVLGQSSGNDSVKNSAVESTF